MSLLFTDTHQHRFASDGRVLVGLDIGGTKTEALVVDGQMRALSQMREMTNTSDPESLVASTRHLIYQALTQAGATPEQVAGIGIGIPGQVNRETGVVSMAVNLNLTAYPLGEAITAEFGVHSYVENDVRIAALGVYRWLLQQQPIQHMVYLSIGTGISAGMILDGRLYRGAHGMAGEIGHIIVEPDGEMCSCGAYGCLETIAAGPAIARHYARAAGMDSPPTAEFVFQAYQDRDPIAQNVVQRVSQALSQAIQWLIMTYDVEKVVLGGGVVNAGPPFWEPLLLALSQLQAQSELTHFMLSPDKLQALPSDFNAGVWGAVMLAQQNDWRQTEL